MGSPPYLPHAPFLEVTPKVVTILTSNNIDQFYLFLTLTKWNQREYIILYLAFVQHFVHAIHAGFPIKYQPIHFYYRMIFHGMPCL